MIPEIELADEAHAAFYDFAAGPQWKLPWPGGQGLARYLLDHPREIRGRSVLDLGCGGGVVSIAACMAGAGRVIAADADERALSACRENLAHHGFQAPGTAIELARVGELSRFSPCVDVLLVAEVLYSAALRRVMIPWLLDRLEAGCTVLLGERSQPGLDALPLELAAQYAVSGADLGGRPQVYPVYVWRAGDPP